MVDAASLSVLDVGHGNCAVLRVENWTVVVDAGPGTGLLEHCEASGIDHLDLVLLSHADADHIRGLIAVLGNGTPSIGRVYLNTDSLKESGLWDSLLFVLDQAHRGQAVEFHTSLNRGDRFEGGDLTIEVLAPSHYISGKGPGSRDRDGDVLTTNAVSAVLRLLRSGRPLVLFAGDLDDVGLKNLLKEEDLPRAEVLIFPHHGGAPGAGGEVARQFAERLTKAVQPHLVLISHGRSRYQNPAPEIVDGIRAADGGVRIACTQLSRTCAPEIPTTSGGQLNHLFASGRSKKHCCAGSFEIELDTTATTDLSRHASFVKLEVATPLCMSPLPTPARRER